MHDLIFWTQSVHSMFSIESLDLISSFADSLGLMYDFPHDILERRSNAAVKFLRRQWKINKSGELFHPLSSVMMLEVAVCKTHIKETMIHEIDIFGEKQLLHQCTYYSLLKVSVTNNSWYGKLQENCAYTLMQSARSYQDFCPLQRPSSGSVYASILLETRGARMPTSCRGAWWFWVVARPFCWYIEPVDEKTFLTLYVFRIITNRPWWTKNWRALGKCGQACFRVVSEFRLFARADLSWTPFQTSDDLLGIFSGNDGRVS